MLNKLSCIVTWLKRNGLVPIIGLLPADERPERREPEGHPFTRAEVDQMMEVAGEHKHLLRLALNSGGPEDGDSLRSGSSRTSIQSTDGFVFPRRRITGGYLRRREASALFPSGTTSFVIC